MRRFFVVVLAWACAIPGGPLPGVWAYTDGGVQSSTCGSDLYQDPDASFLLLDVTPGSFRIDDGRGEPFDCTIRGRSFDCPERAAEVVPIEGTDVQLTYVVSVEGRLIDATHMEGTQTFTLDCEGSLCSLGAALIGAEIPCAYEVAFTASL